MHALVLQHIACEHPGIFRQFMQADGIAWDTVEMDQAQPIPALDEYDFMLVMGGPMDVWMTEQYAWLQTEIDAIRHWVVQLQKPYLGFCLGHQLLGVALGGSVAPAKTPEIGIMDVALTPAGLSSPFLKGCPQRLPCLQWHSAEIAARPPGAVVLAESPACTVNAMAWQQHAFSVQFHIELTADTVREWGQVPAYAQALEKALGRGALPTLVRQAGELMPTFNALSQTLYDNFIGQVRRLSAD